MAKQLIPNGTAQEVFTAGRTVVACQEALASAAVVRKGCREALDAAQDRLMELLGKAERGERDLFAEQVADPPAPEATEGERRVLCPDCEGACRQESGGPPSPTCKGKGYTEPESE